MRVFTIEERTSHEAKESVQDLGEDSHEAKESVQDLGEDSQSVQDMGELVTRLHVTSLSQKVVSNMDMTWA